MAFRGRGREQGGFGHTDHAKPEPFVLFPEITLPVPEVISKDSDLIVRHAKYENLWINSSYHLGDGVLKRDNGSLDIERFSDTLKPKSKSNKSESFHDYLVLRPDNFPRELLEDTRKERPVKRAKWSLDADLRKLDVLEKLEAKFQAEGEGKKREEEDDDDDDKPPEYESDESDSDRIPGFDDDEDDYNREDDDGGFEAVY